MNSFLNLANKRIANVIKELNSDAKIAMNKATDQEKGKITLALLYYKIVLQGCISFENDVSGYVKALKDCSMDESDIGLILDKYCGETAISISLGDIELDENPYIDIDVKEVKNPGDIELDENPEINIDVKDIKSSLDIELDENPIINMEVKEVFNDLDIILDENPYIDIDVKEVKNPGDIEMDENPNIRMEVKEVKNPGDIEMDENPNIRMEVKEVKNPGDIEMEENPNIRMEVKEVKNLEDIPKRKDSGLLGNIKFNVKENSKQYVFNAKEYEEQVKAEREAKRKKNKK